jgi:hypothetical protein
VPLQNGVTRRLCSNGYMVSLNSISALAKYLIIPRIPILGFDYDHGGADGDAAAR